MAVYILIISHKDANFTLSDLNSLSLRTTLLNLRGKRPRNIIREPQCEPELILSRISSYLLQHIQDELLEDLVNAHGQGVMAEALAEVTCPQQIDQLPHSQTADL